MNNETVTSLRDQGYCVVVFTPEEIRNANPSKVEDRLVELGWEVIDDLSWLEENEESP